MNKYVLTPLKIATLFFSLIIGYSSLEKHHNTILDSPDINVDMQVIEELSFVNSASHEEGFSLVMASLFVSVITENGNVFLSLSIITLLFLSSGVLMYMLYKQYEIKGKLHHSKELMRYVIEHNNAAVAIHDKDLKYVYVSKNYLEQFNIQEEDVIGKHHYEVFPDLPEKWREIHQKALKGKVSSSSRDPYEREDGTVLWTRWEARPWFDDNKIAGIIIYTEVINAQIELEQQLQEKLSEADQKNEELDATLMSIGDGVIITDNKGVVVNINTITEQLTGYTQSLAKGMLFDDFFNAINEKTRDKTKSPIQKVLETENRVELENHTILIHKDGTERFIEDSCMPIKNQQGDLIGAVLVFRDVSERVEKDQTIDYQRQRLSKVVESSADIIFEVDPELKFVSVFGKGLNLLGIKPNEFEGKTVLDIFGDSGKERYKAYKKALEGKTVYYTWEFESSSGTHYFESSVSPIYDANEVISGAVGIARDVTEKTQKQKEIEYISFHDFLTGLNNRRYFAEMISSLDDERHCPLGIMMIDLNGLKIINDAYGHEVGDVALKEFANLLMKLKCVNHHIARIGGDEFAMILEKTNFEELENMKNEISEQASNITIQNIELSVAVGYDMKSSNEDHIGDILKNAENDMYKRKLFEGISARNKSIRAILKTLTTKYEEERLHSERVANISEKIGESLKLSKDDINELKMAATFHDIGKISIPDAILDKPNKLTQDEYEIIKTHTENGYQILRAADEYSDLAIDALYHHEWWNGKGYPEGISGEEIPLFSRIISIADTFEAITSNRPYRKAKTKEFAIAEIKKYSGTQFDPRLVDVFVNEVLTNDIDL